MQHRSLASSHQVESAGEGGGGGGGVTTHIEVTCIRRWSCLMGRAEVNSSADMYRSAYREQVDTKAAGE